MPDTPDVILECRNLWKVFGNLPGGFADQVTTRAADDIVTDLQATGAVPAIRDVSLDVRRGEILMIMGLSGSGKSTLLRCLSRLVEPSAGAVCFEGQDILTLKDRQLTDLRRNAFGMVFQSFGLLDHLNARDNVAFPLRVQNVPKAERHRRADELLDLVGLGDRKSNFPHELSGGQQQRVSIARSLISDPDLWFLDEPFSALDPLIRRQMQDEFLRLQTTLGKTIVFVTHDFLEAARLGDRIAIMRDGQLVQLGTPRAIILSPADDYVRDFVADVPASRILHVADLVTEGAADGAPQVHLKDPLELAIDHFLSGHEALQVLDDNDLPAGQIRRDDLHVLTGQSAHG
ncbi:MAG: ATP-binding cassette domain-containing protein [Silicimonas sp.]|nr:ATP-binding cassette domain-containing protein [Silicimonas sp.]